MRACKHCGEEMHRVKEVSVEGRDKTIRVAHNAEAYLCFACGLIIYLSIWECERCGKQYTHEKWRCNCGYK